MIGIVILNYNSWLDTKRCVESIDRNPPVEKYVLILVDNASAAAPPFCLSDFVQRYRIILIRNKKNKGYNAGNNAGVAKALAIGCSSILISNSDVRYLPGSIQQLLDCLKSYPKAGIAGPAILDRYGNLQKCCLCQKTGIKEKYLVRTRANVLFAEKKRTYFGLDRDYHRPFFVYAVLGCCFMMTRACARAVTPFDEYPFLYEEELMLGIHMEKAGFMTIYNPKAVIVHRHGGSTRQKKAFSFAQNVRSEIYYCRNYLYAPGWQIIPLYVYRIFLYFIRCMASDDYRKNWKQFLKLTGEEMRNGRKCFHRRMF